MPMKAFTKEDRAKGGAKVIYRGVVCTVTEESQDYERVQCYYLPGYATSSGW